jgi:hypothetical protein
MVRGFEQNTGWGDSALAYFEKHFKTYPLGKGLHEPVAVGISFKGVILPAIKITCSTSGVIEMVSGAGSFRLRSIVYGLRFPPPLLARLN